MGTLNPPSDNVKVAGLNKSARVLVVGSAAHMAALSQAGGAPFPGLKLAELDPAAPVPASLLAGASLLVIEVDPNNRSSMQRLGEIRENHPQLTLVAAIEDASVSLVRTLVRQGFADVVALPFDLEEVLQVSLDATAKSEAESISTNALAPMVSVVRSIGGCGATSIATHLAADLASHDRTERGVVIADLDLQFGSVADYLGIETRSNLTDLLGAAERLDEDLLRSVAVEAGGVSVIAAPDAILPLESVDTDALLRTIRLLRQQFGYVVLDLPANWTNWALSATLESDIVVLVVELSVGSLRQAKRRLELFRSVGIADDAIKIVVNRVEKRLFRTIDLADVSETLRHPVLGSVALDAPLVNTAQNQGQLVGAIQRKSRFAADIAKISDLLRSGRLARSTH
jgi:pilus assembly protein CpaE